MTANVLYRIVGRAGNPRSARYMFRLRYYDVLFPVDMIDNTSSSCRAMSPVKSLPSRRTLSSPPRHCSSRSLPGPYTASSPTYPSGNVLSVFITILVCQPKPVFLWRQLMFVVDSEMDAAGTDRFRKAVVRVILVASGNIFSRRMRLGGGGGADMIKAPFQIVVGKLDLPDSIASSSPEPRARAADMVTFSFEMVSCIRAE
jgi:hypothetical protein